MPKLAITLDRVHGAGAFRGVLTLEAPDGSPLGTRELTRPGPSCHVLDGPLAIVAALLIDAAQDSIRLAVPPPPNLEGIPPPRSASPGPTASSDASWTAQSEVAATLLLGLLPPAPGARLDTRVTPADLPVLLRLDAFPYAMTPRASPSGARGEFFAVAGTLGLCPEYQGHGWKGDACLGIMSGVIHASCQDVPVPGASTSVVPMVIGGVGARVRLGGPVWLRASTELAWGDWPANWHVLAPGGPDVVVWKPWPVALVGSFGVVFETPSEKRRPFGH